MLGGKKIAAVLPARMGSSRFPGKPLAPILDLPMIEHVRRRVEQIDFLDEVCVATCDQEIKNLVEANGGNVIMTSTKHERATDRIEEAAYKLESEIIINVQGDEPMVSASAIKDLVLPFVEQGSSQAAVDCSCIIYPVKNLDDLTNDNIVKVVLSRSNRILYLSRSPIPGNPVDKKFSYYKQSGLMAFTKSFLHAYQKMEPTPLEIKESVDLNRILEHDSWVQAVYSEEETIGVDIPAQIEQVESAILTSKEQKQIYESLLN